MIKKDQKKILIAEDDRVLLQIYEKNFQLKGYTVFTTTSGQTTEKIAKKEKPSLILLDVIMPGQDGFTTLNHLKSNIATKKIPVILLTNLGQEKDMNKGKAIGADSYLVKNNITPQEVIAFVEKKLRKK